MVSEERAGLLWIAWVGWLEPRQFMERAQRWELEKGAWWTTVHKAVDDYLERLDKMFGPGTRDHAPEDLEEAMVQFISSTLDIEPNTPWYVAA
jgi:hypothetical protein